MSAELYCVRENERRCRSELQGGLVGGEFSISYLSPSREPAASPR